MPTESSGSAKDIFLTAIEFESAEAREAYLEEACGGDESLKRRVTALILAHERPESLLDRAAPQVNESMPFESTRALSNGELAGPQLDGLGGQIGPFKLLQVIGEGGMGVVYMAEQTKPVKRRVALKVIKPGMDSRQIIARFDAERQALAMMDHPNIARVLEAGTTESGRPYFVMELVRGLPITEYCDQHRLTPNERLDLFIQVCHAVQHAHQKGVIHRDIKPSNVLVADYDDKPVPKVIDFGLAKAVSFTLTDMTNFTRLGQVVGTFEYMSPEQAKFNQLDVDTRTDIYSLGVLLYELLTGCTPIERQRLKSAAFEEMLRIIREEEPPKPSTRISSLGKTAHSLSASRRTDPQALLKLVRGDLDCVVMKALEKNRSRRYQTASELVADLDRYRHDEHVLARPASAGYRLKKTLRRYRRAVTVAAFLILSLIGGIAGTTMGMLGAQRARDEAHATLERLLVELRVNAITRAMNLDIEQMQQALADAREAGATEAWCKMVEAIPFLFQGDIDVAEELLEQATQATKSGENSLSLAYLRAWTRFCNGWAVPYFEDATQLLASEPVTSEEKLFASLALHPMSPEQSLEWANQAFGEFRSPVALMLRSTALAVVAGETGRLDLALEAVFDAHTALRFLPNSPYAIHTCLYAHLNALILGQESEGEAFVREHIEACERFAEQLKKFPRHGLGNLFAAGFHLRFGDAAKARERCEALRDHGAGPFFKGAYVGFLYSQNKIEEALRELSGMEGDVTYTHARAVLLAEQNETRDEARRLLEQCLAEPAHPAMQVRWLGALCAIGYPEVSKRQAIRLVEQSANDCDAFDHELILFFAGRSNSPKILELAGDRRSVHCTAHLLIAQKELGQGHRDVAREHLKQCIAYFGHLDYDAAQGMLKRMEDPQWPYWMSDVQHQAVGQP